VAAISERMARRWWPGEALPIGRRIQIGVPREAGRWLTIVGVVGNAPQSVFNREPVCMVYVPYVQAPRDRHGYRRPRFRRSLAPGAGGHGGHPLGRSGAAITLVSTLEALRHDEALGIDYVAVWHGHLRLAGAGAFLHRGCMDVMAYLVSEQTHEIGIRMALGARGRTCSG